MDYSNRHKAFTLLQENKFTEAVEFLDHANLFDREVDWQTLMLYNNYLIACAHSNQLSKGLSALERMQDHAHLNPHIYHNAACLFCRSNLLEEAIGQVKLARKYGGTSLMKILKNDADLAPIASRQDFIDATNPIIQKYALQKFTIPFEGYDHPLFDELWETEMISMFFSFRNSFEDDQKTNVQIAIDNMIATEHWHNVVLNDPKGYRGWNDCTVIGRDFITLHLKNTWQPKPLMKEAYELMSSFEQQLTHTFFSKRERKSKEFGTVNPAVNESSLAIAFSPTKNEDDFWKSSFDYTKPYPSPEYSGHPKSYGHHDGSLSEELRSITYDPFFRISYGLVSAKVTDDSTRAKDIFEFFQGELSKYFTGEIPMVLNALGDAKIDTIYYHGRTGYRIEIVNNDLLEDFHTRYVFRIKDAEIFRALKDTVIRFHLSTVIHWHRDKNYTFDIWEGIVHSY